MYYLEKYSQTFLINGQIVNIFGFALLQPLSSAIVAQKQP